MSIPVKNGLFLGAAFLIGTIAFVLGSPRGFITYSSYAFFLIAVVMMIKTANDVKIEQGGFATFGELFKNMIITVAVGYVFRIIALYIAYNFINPDLSQIQIDVASEGFESMSGLMGDEMMDKMYEELEKMNPSGVKTLVTSYFTYLVTIGAITNAIISAILQKKKPLIDVV